MGGVNGFHFQSYRPALSNPRCRSPLLLVFLPNWNWQRFVRSSSATLILLEVNYSLMTSRHIKMYQFFFKTWRSQDQIIGSKFSSVQTCSMFTEQQSSSQLLQNKVPQVKKVETHGRVFTNRVRLR